MSAKDPYTFEPLAADATADSQGRPLPRGYAAGETVTIALAGARSSGKSVYIAVALERLASFVHALGGTFEATPSTKSHYEEVYRKPLFDDNTRLQATPPGMQEPLIFDLGFQRPVGDEPSKKLFVVIRDVAGEDMRDEAFNRIRDELGFFRWADTIVFLYDPLEVPKVRKLLEDAGKPGMAAMESGNGQDSDPDTILKNIIELMENKEHNPHMSLTLSKFDTLQQLEALARPEDFDLVGGSAEVDWAQVMGNHGLASRREGSPEDAPWDPEDAWLLEQEVRSMLSELAEYTVTNRLAQPMPNGEFLRHNFYAVSALGRMLAHDARIDDIGIAPFRVLDPFRAVFHNRGLLGQ